MMNRIFRASNSIASAAVVLGSAGLISRLLGVYRDRLLATTFGAGSSLDAYYAAFRVPDFIYSLLVLGALSAGFIPVFLEYSEKSRERAWEMAQSVFLFLVIVMSLISGVLFILAPWIIPLLTPGFDSLTLENTIGLTRIMLLSPIILGMSSVFGGVLQSFKRFIAYSLAPIFYNLGIIFGIFAFIKPFGLKGLAYGVVLGALLHLIIQAAAAFKVGYKFSLPKFWKEKGVSEIMRMMGPRAAALGFIQLNLLVITTIASTLEKGSVTIFNFAHNLAHVPIGLFGISFAVAAFPVLSEYANHKERYKFDKVIYRTTSQILFFLLPTLVVFVLLDEQIVRLVYGAGQFDWESTLLTAKTLLFFVPHILAISLFPLLARAFYARKDTKHPFYTSVASFVVVAVLGYWFRDFFNSEGVVGLAAALGIASTVQVLMLLYWLKFKISEDFKRMITTIKEIAVASAFMVVAIQLVKEFLGPFLDLLTVKGVLVHFLLPAFVGGLAYLLILKVAGSEEYVAFEDGIRRRFKVFSAHSLPAVSTGEEDKV